MSPLEKENQFSICWAIDWSKMAKIYTGSYVEDELNVVSSVLSSVVPILLMTTMTFPCMESHLWFDLKGF